MTIVVPAVDTKSEVGSVHHHLQTETPRDGRGQAGLHADPGTPAQRNCLDPLTNAGRSGLFPSWSVAMPR